MKVLLQTRSAVGVEKSPGGDVTQAHETARALEAIGIDTHVSSELRPDLTGVDLVHIFNLVRPQDAILQARNGWRHGLPVALSTVYCDMWEFDRSARTGVGGLIARRVGRGSTELAKTAGRAVRSKELHRGLAPLVWPGYQALQRELLERSDVLLPNSRSELRRIEQDLNFEISSDRHVVVPNGIDADYYRADDLHDCSVPEHLFRHEGCVLCVGRVEGRKNQLSLIRALRDSPYRLILVGPPAANQSAYVDAVRAEVASSPNVEWLGAVSEDEKRWLYKLAWVHVLPSWMETTGLASLEAAALGCALVVTPNGDTQEHFAGHASFCEPDDVQSIRVAVDAAHRVGPDPALKQRIFADYTWDAAARASTRGYAMALVQSHSRSVKTRQRIAELAAPADASFSF